MTKRFAIITGVLLLAVIIAATGCPPQGAELTPADFYKGKTVDFTTTGSAGTFNDLSAHIIANYLGSFTPTLTVNPRCLSFRLSDRQRELSVVLTRVKEFDFWIAS